MRRTIGYTTIVLHLYCGKLLAEPAKVEIQSLGTASNTMVFLRIPPSNSGAHSWKLFVADLSLPIKDGRTSFAYEWVTIPTEKHAAGTPIVCSLLNENGRVIDLAASSVPFLQADPNANARNQIIVAVLAASVAIGGIFIGAWIATGRERRRDCKLLREALRFWLGQEMAFLTAVKLGSASLSETGTLVIPPWLSGGSFPQFATALSEVKAIECIETARSAFRAVRSTGNTDDCITVLGKLYAALNDS